MTLRPRSGGGDVKALARLTAARASHAEGRDRGFRGARALVGVAPPLLRQRA
jgi:hypothetical protein